MNARLMYDLRILLWPDCNRNCKGCCNQAWDLEKLPQATVHDVKRADMIILTGGEPMLFTYQLRKYIATLRGITNVPIYVYTAKVDQPDCIKVLDEVDGLTLTLHVQGDVEPFLEFAEAVENIKDKSLRLNIIKGVEIDEIPEGWVAKTVEWHEDGECPLPPKERFMRI